MFFLLRKRRDGRKVQRNWLFVNATSYAGGRWTISIYTWTCTGRSLTWFTGNIRQYLFIALVEQRTTNSNSLQSFVETRNAQNKRNLLRLLTFNKLKIKTFYTERYLTMRTTVQYENLTVKYIFKWRPTSEYRATTF